jgi:hypothetical protein
LREGRGVTEWVAQVYTAQVFASASPWPSVYNVVFDLKFRAADIPSKAHMPSRIPRGFLEREANVKQTHRFR